jgi:hypothetical protein
MNHYYIYGLYKDNKLIYVGRSFAPYVRQNNHYADGIDFDYCKILDKQEDIERKWILDSLKKGAVLLNKNITPAQEEWNIDDIVYIRK